jgi:predicted nucleic acid-binding protein
MARRPAFFDTSIVLQTMFGQPGELPDWSYWGHHVASELMRYEVMRAFDCARLRTSLGDAAYADLAMQFRELTGAFEFVPLSRAVLERVAGSFPTIVRTLDAIHLSTALLWAEKTGQIPDLLTHDRQLAIAARACGLDVHPWPNPPGRV